LTLAYRMLARLFPPRDGASLHALVRAAVGTGAVPPDLLEYLEATLSLPELTLRDVMVPRVDVVAVSENCSAREAARQMAAHGHTRAPVYRDSPDRPIGILHALDLLRELATRTTSSRGLPRAGKLARPALSLPDTLSVLEAVRAMRSQAAHIALVVDERGGLAGLVTLEDLLEQFVGPVPDEYSDDSRAAIRRIDKGIAVVGATARLHQLERVLGVRFPKTRFTTIGGLVYDHLRRVPKPGDVVQLPGICIEVLSVDGPRLRDLRIQTTTATTHRAAFVELGIGKEVICGGDVVGQVERLIADPGSPRVRQVVVRRGNRSVVIPLEVIERTDEDVAYLRADACDLDRFPDYVPPNVSVGTEVMCTDGPAGRVRRVVLDRQSGAVTHLVVRISSALLLPRDVVIPLSWARSITPERIELVASRDDLLDLPEFRSDDDMRIELLRRLNEDPRFQGIDRYTQKIEVYGGFVRLSGRVRPCKLKQAAEQLARGTSGVLSVDNQLIADEELVVGVEQALRGEGLDIEDLEVSALLGRVTLRGRAATPEVSAAAERLARGVPGVESVVNKLFTRAPYAFFNSAGRNWKQMK